MEQYCNLGTRRAGNGWDRTGGGEAWIGGKLCRNGGTERESWEPKKTGGGEGVRRGDNNKIPIKIKPGGGSRGEWAGGGGWQGGGQGKERMQAEIVGGGQLSS